MKANTNVAGLALPPLILGLAFFLSWEAYVRLFGIDPLLLPAPSAVVEFLLADPMLFLRHASSSLLVILGGFAMGSIAGLSLGVAMSSSPLIRRAVYPWLVASQMVPVPAVAPILLLWMGFTIWPKLLVVALICFFPVAVNTIDGLRRVDRETLDLLRTFRASRLQQLRMVSLPAALPSVFSGFRVAMALAVIAAIFGEWVGTRLGLGQLMLVYNNQARTAGLFATVAVLAVIGITLFLAVGWLERRLLPWRQAIDEDTSL
jgi:ABC-type nitrate/sulfonate/bicarbonate transport system permease component